MMNRKGQLYSVLAFGIVLAVYCLLFLVIPFDKTAASWISFGFTVLAICLCAAVFMCTFCRKEIKSKLYGFPIFKIALIYAAIQLFVGIIICVISAFVDVPIWIPIVIYSILLALGAIGSIATNSAKNAIEEIDAEMEQRTQTFALLQINIEGTIDLCTNEGLRYILEKLKEDFRYSDPVSCPETEEAENALVADMEKLRSLVTEQNFTEATTLADNIRIRLAERNRICKMYKRRGN